MMTEEMLPKAWNEFVSKLTYFPVIVKTLERIHDVNWSMEPNIHNHFEMVYIKRGNAIFNIENVDVPLSPNHIIILKPKQWHKFTVKSPSCEFLVLSFTFHTGENPDNYSLEDFIDSFKNMENGSFITLRLAPKNDITAIMHKIIRERDRGEQWSEFFTYLLIIELFVSISRIVKQDWEQSSRFRSINLDDSMSLAKEYIEQNYNKDITLADISKYIYISESYFAHSFKNKFGISPKNYILKIRIKAACEMLAKTDMMIGDIALHVGFSSQQRFNDIFKKHKGKTPLKYKKEYKRTMLNIVDNK